MTDPPKYGVVQEIQTQSATIEVVGAEGTSGFYAARIETVKEGKLSPAEFLAKTQNLYVTPGVNPVTVRVVPRISV